MSKESNIEKGSNNVFRDLGFPEAEAQLLLLKCDLALRICKAIDKLGFAPAKAAKHVGLTLPRFKELTKNQSDTFTLEELFTVAVGLGYSIKLKIKKSDSKHQMSKTARLTFKSDAFEAIHSSASALYKVGAIDEVAMHRFDASAAKKTPQQNLLTPPPKELQKALAQSAKRARALAAAYGVKVPYSRVKTPKVAAST